MVIILDNNLKHSIMNININLVSSLKVGEFIQVSETEVLACVEWTKCEECYFNGVDREICYDVCHDGYTDLMYRLFKLKQ